MSSNGDCLWGGNPALLTPRQPPMQEGRYRCPLTRYTSIHLSSDCQKVTFDTPEETIRHGVQYHNQKVCWMCHMIGGRVALVGFFDKPSSLKSHLVSSVHETELKRRGWYETVQQSETKSLNWLAVKAQELQDYDRRNSGSDVVCPCMTSSRNVHPVGEQDTIQGESIPVTYASDPYAIRDTLSGDDGEDISPAIGNWEEYFWYIIETAPPHMRKFLQELQGPVVIPERIDTSV
ncbi:hypothetical protein BDD12DRAFT_805749 [Trichophaea hybrida]|nr:hypothetical protein BDD12DRAFT_805749 [Trichophaea hybrida]